MLNTSMLYSSEMYVCWTQVRMLYMGMPNTGMMYMYAGHKLIIHLLKGEQVASQDTSYLRISPLERKHMIWIVHKGDTTYTYNMVI